MQIGTLMFRENSPSFRLLINKVQQLLPGVMTKCSAFTPSRGGHSHLIARQCWGPYSCAGCWLGFAYSPGQIMYRKDHVRVVGIWATDCLWCVCMCACVRVPFYIFYNLNVILISGAQTCFRLGYYIWPTISPCSETFSLAPPFCLTSLLWQCTFLL